MADGALTLNDWTQDALPDLLWPALVLAESGTAAARRFVNWQGEVADELRDEVESERLARGLDGTLSGLSGLAGTDENTQALLRSRATEHGLMSTAVQSALASYPHRLAEWLVPRELQPPDQDDVELLAKAVYEAISDGHREAVLKCLSIWSAVHSRTFSSSEETIGLLVDYPTNELKRSGADSAVRAMWGARQSLEQLDHRTERSAIEGWSRVFWGANSMTTQCVRKRDMDREEPDNGVDASSAPADGTDYGTPDGVGMIPGSSDETDLYIGHDPVPPEGAHLRRLAMDLLSSYIEVVDQGPRSLRDPSELEVHSGLVARAGRDVIAALGTPELWSVEQGGHVVRALVEARVYLEWMSQQPKSVYKAFKDYGAGKAKLYSRILDEIPEEARQKDFVDAVEQLKKLSYNDDIFDSRVVDTRDTFSGLSLRAMAEESGLLDFYRQAYSLASGVAHGEWWSLENHAMERCLNVLHRGHLIPSLSLSAGGSTPLAKSWVNQLYKLMWRSLEIVQPDEQIWHDAFAWLRPAEPNPGDD
ncbi:DUF5677 domain-containing protein [Microbacterium sp. P02]|uniref:DUF5677 domain-containing protein n=1 Tax=Microbacterium sp. P02 TaxID=3366260 RepID=UPI0036705B01